MTDKISYKSILFVFLFLFFSNSVNARTYHVSVHLKTGLEIKGVLIAFTSNGIKLDPDGAVSFRFLMGNEIDYVYINELNKKYFFPIKNEDIPKELKIKIKPTLSQNFGRHKYLFHISYGGISTNSNGYYEGFTSGSAFHIEGYYVFDADEIASVRTFAGLSFYHASISGEQIDAYYYSVQSHLSVNHYGFDVGAMTSMKHKSYYFYGIIGFAIISNKISLPISDFEINLNDTIGGARFGIGFVKSITSNLGFKIAGNIDFVFSGTYINEYGNEAPYPVGMLTNYSFGLEYGF